MADGVSPEDPTETRAHGVDADVLQALLDASPDGLCLLDADGTVVATNDRMEQFLRQPDGALVGRDVMEVVHPDTLTVSTMRLREAVSTGRVVRGEDVVDGATYEVVIVPVPETPERPAMFAVHARDVTAERAAVGALRAIEQELARRTEELQALVSASPVAIDAVDDAGRVVLWNAAAERLLGWSAAEVIGRPNPAIPSGASEEEAKVLADAFGAGTPVHDFETLRRHREGRLVQVSLSAAPIVGADGEVTGRVDVLLDITDRHVALAELERSRAELGATNEELRRFTAAVSHDLRAPLVTLQGFVAELDRGLRALEPAAVAGAPTLPAEARRAALDALGDVGESLAFVHAAVERMDHLISALMRLARIGRRDFLAEEIDLAEVVAATVGALATDVRDSGAAITVGQLPVVVADRVALEQIVTNLLENALRYLRPGVRGRVEVWGERVGDELRLYVADNGRGIRPEDAEAVWAPLRRAATDVPGEGLGLATVDSLVRRHGGTVGFQSTPGEGTTFTVTFPARPTGAVGAHGA